VRYFKEKRGVILPEQQKKEGGYGFAEMVDILLS